MFDGKIIGVGASLSESYRQCYGAAIRSNCFDFVVKSAETHYGMGVKVE